jgi:hypothetical protein
VTVKRRLAFSSAVEVVANPDYAGGPINLVTCGGACGPAQEMEEILGVPVNASRGMVDLDPVGGFLRKLPC